APGCTRIRSTDTSAPDAPGLVPQALAEYMGPQPAPCGHHWNRRQFLLAHVSRAAQGIWAGMCRVALITLAGRRHSDGLWYDVFHLSPGTCTRRTFRPSFRSNPRRRTNMPSCPQRHMHEFGTTSEQLGWIKVAASHHAQHNCDAMLRDVVTVEDVLNSPMIS